MKTQLIEDIGDSHPQPDISPLDDAPAAGDDQRPSLAPSAPQAASRRAGTWRQRDAGSAAAAEPPVAAPRPPPPPERPLFRPNADPLADVWAVANPEAGPTWFQRWGRRTVAWTGAFAAVLLMSGGAAWLYRESTTDQALASLASATQHTTALRAALRYVQPIDVQPSELALEAPGFIADIPDFAAPPEPVKRVRRPPQVIAKVVRKPPPIIAKAARKAPPAPPRPDPVKARESRMAETLRQCRAAGYHAEACVKRGCVATPYGIACKG